MGMNGDGDRPTDDPRWQQKRLVIFNRDKFTCQNCGNTKRTLNVHHKWYAGPGRGLWEVPDDWLVTLCRDCHQRVTELRRRANNVLGDLNTDQLLRAVALLEHAELAVVAPEQPAEQPVVRPSQLLGDVEPGPVALLLADCDRERDAVIRLPYTTARSRYLEALDELTEKIRALVVAAKPALGNKPPWEQWTFAARLPTED